MPQRQECERFTLPIALRDGLNRPIPDVSTADLQGKMHGKPVKMGSLKADARPHRVVLLLDASGSVGGFEDGSPRWPLELKLAWRFLEATRQQSPVPQVALIIFNNQATEVVEFSEENKEVRDRLRAIASDKSYLKEKIRGKTALRDAILQGLQLLRHPTSADALYVLSDGEDNASKHGESEVSEQMAAASVRLFAVLIRGGLTPSRRTPEELPGPPALTEIAQKSGGEVLSTAEPKGEKIVLSAYLDPNVSTEETLSRLYQTILQNSLLEIELPSPIVKRAVGVETFGCCTATVEGRSDYVSGGFGWMRFGGCAIQRGVKVERRNKPSYKLNQVSTSFWACVKSLEMCLACS